MILGNSPELLKQFEDMLDSDPLIDEIGFIHPTQFVALNEEAGCLIPSTAARKLQSEDGVLRSKTSTINSSETIFWCRDHKLGISTEIILPLYNAAKHRFMNAFERYKTHNHISAEKGESGGSNLSRCLSSFQDILEDEVMKQSKALLLLSCDFGTAWNARKLVLSNKQQFEKLVAELYLASLVLSCAPKSEWAWSHRRWVIKVIAGQYSNLHKIVEEESELVKKLAEKSKMNYRAWNHRCWLVSYMSREQVLHELENNRGWTGLHIADHSCFHYRTRLLLRMLEDIFDKPRSTTSSGCYSELRCLWKEELDWNNSLIRRYIGREALWLHRRFLSLGWIKHFSIDIRNSPCHSDHEDSTNHEIGMFMDNEAQLFHSCSTIVDSDFEDFRAHAVYSATYILWLIKQTSIPLGVEHQRPILLTELKTFIEEVCPEKMFLWYSLHGGGRST